MGSIKHRYYPMIILGIDVGSRNLGISVCDFREGKESLLKAESIYLKQNDIRERMLYVESLMTSLVQEHGVTQITYEAPYMKRGKNAMDLYFIAAVIQLTSFRLGLPVMPVAPSSVKLQVGGSGKAEKRQVENGVRDFFGDPTLTFAKDHASDAAAIAITGFKNTNG